MPWVFNPHAGGKAISPQVQTRIRSRITVICAYMRLPCQAYLTWAFERLGTHRDHLIISASPPSNSRQPPSRLRSPEARSRVHNVACGGVGLFRDLDEVRDCKIDRLDRARPERPQLLRTHDPVLSSRNVDHLASSGMNSGAPPGRFAERERLDDTRRVPDLASRRR